MNNLTLIIHSNHNVFPRPEEDVAALERIESRLSGRSKLIDSPVKAATPNPLKVLHVYMLTKSTLNLSKHNLVEIYVYTFLNEKTTANKPYVFIIKTSRFV